MQMAFLKKLKQFTVFQAKRFDWLFWKSVSFASLPNIPLLRPCPGIPPTTSARPLCLSSFVFDVRPFIYWKVFPRAPPNSKLFYMPCCINFSHPFNLIMKLFTTSRECREKYELIVANKPQHSLSIKYYNKRMEMPLRHHWHDDPVRGYT